MLKIWSTLCKTKRSRASARPLRRWGVVALTAVFLTTALNLLGAAQEANRARYRVEIKHFKFVPERLTVAPGDTVVWVNLDLVPHTVTAKDESWDSQP